MKFTETAEREGIRERGYSKKKMFGLAVFDKVILVTFTE